MFDFDVGKLVVVGVVALIVIGPKDLPRVLRQVGQVVGKMRRMASEFQGQFMEAMREADVSDVKAEVEKIADSAKFDVAFDPLKDVREQITATSSEVNAAIAGETVPHTTEQPAIGAEIAAPPQIEAPALAETPVAIETKIHSEPPAPVVPEHAEQHPAPATDKSA